MWQGSGHYFGATMIVTADCLKSAQKIIKKELIDCELAKSWEESREIEEIEINDCKLIWGDDGNY